MLQLIETKEAGEGGGIFFFLSKIDRGGLINELGELFYMTDSCCCFHCF